LGAKRALRGGGETVAGRLCRGTGLVGAAVILIVANGCGALPGRHPGSAAGPSPGPTTVKQDVPTGWTTSSLGELGNATLVVPPWPRGAACPAGTVTLTAGSHEYKDATLTVYQTAPGDVTGDGAPEQVAVLNCQGARDSHSDYLAVAFRKVGSTYRPLGNQAVMRSGTDGVASMFQVLVLNRAVWLDVGDVDDKLGYWSEVASQHQSRVYTWNGQRFTQTGGPTTFPAHPAKAKFAVTAGDLALTTAGAPAGRRLGALKITVKNAGNLAAPSVSVQFELPIGVGAWGTGWADCTRSDNGDGKIWQAECRLGQLAPGAAKTVTYQVVTDAGYARPAGEAKLTATALQAARPYVPQELSLWESTSYQIG
jgi:hypothetical protein